MNKLMQDCLTRQDQADLAVLKMDFLVDKITLLASDIDQRLAAGIEVKSSSDWFENLDARLEHIVSTMTTKIARPACSRHHDKYVCIRFHKHLREKMYLPGTLSHQYTSFSFSLSLSHYIYMFVSILLFV